MLKQRILTAVVSIPLLCIVLIWGNPLLISLLFVSVSILSTHEAFAMLSHKLDRVLSNPSEPSSHKYPTYLVWILSFLLFAVLHSDDPIVMRAGLAFVLFLPFFIHIFWIQDNDLAIAKVFATILSLAYGVLPWVCMKSLYEVDSGYLWTLLAIVWGGDTAAYFGGMSFGKNKLLPRLSPKKTREGAVCGLIASIFMAVLFSSWVFSLHSPYVSAAMGLFGGVAGQMGDLIESSLKRFSNVKDSGQIFPGHGGILDRCDGLIFAGPIYWFLVYYL